MLWAYLALAAAFFWSVTELFDKFVMDHEIDTGRLAAALSSVPFFLAFVVTAPLFGKISFSGSIVGAGFLSGVIYYLALQTYYEGIRLEEVSRFIPTLSFSTVFIAAVAYIFLGERFSIPVYIGVLSTVAGSILISLENPLESLKSFESKKGLYLAIAAAVLFASKDLVFKYLVSGGGFWTIIFWTGVGGLCYTALALFMEKKNLENGFPKGSKHMALIGSLNALAYYTFAASLSYGPVSLASAVAKASSVFVFAGSTAISRFHPEIIHEELDTSTLLQKLLATVLIIGGVVVIQLLR
jgi:transporter family protein